MNEYRKTLTPEDAQACAAYVAWMQRQADEETRGEITRFPLTKPVANVQALLDSFLEPGLLTMRRWLQDHPEELRDKS